MLRRCFRSKLRICCVENACKVSNLARISALHLRLLPRKTASQTKSQQPLERVMHFPPPARAQSA
ncbi:hypothetical protein EII18_03975 [Comamonadaceae bacterium OH3737_COT-264]|nr:hypothetical protein EII18_03975 [Comamonadaceae bacterium OH3737_COT-264]